MPQLHPLQIEPLIKRALEEDWGHGDWTTDLCVARGKQATAQIIAKEECVLAGIDVAKKVFATVDSNIQLTPCSTDGDRLAKGGVLLKIQGRAQSILKAERVALNFLGRMCGIATSTQAFVQTLEGSKAQILDTRKTTPGLRLLEKYATAIGGARNHRLCLTDGVMIKENHIRAAGSITSAVESLHESLPPTIKVEVETTNLEEVQEAIEAGVDLIMLDNMPVAEMAMAVRTARGRVLLEASGNVTRDRLKAIAETGVDFISTSAILHSSRWSDLSLLFAVE